MTPSSPVIQKQVQEVDLDILIKFAEENLATRRFQDAAIVYSDLLEGPHSAIGLSGLARCLMYLGDWGGMQAALQTLQQVDPKSEAAIMNLAALQANASSVGYNPTGTWFAEQQRRVGEVEDDLVYDVGMNNGDDTAYYLRRGFRVVAVEADPDLCRCAATRFERALEEGRLSIVNVGIAAQPGSAKFWICDQKSEWNSFNRHIAARDGLPHHSIDIPCQTFRWIIAHYGVPHYLKVDIEGNDTLCIDDLEQLAILPQYVSFELGPIDQFVGRLSALGYDSFKCISQFNYVPLELPPAGQLVRTDIPPPEVTRVVDGWTFPGGASGPFGEETRGRWLSAEEAVRTYHYYAQLCRNRVPSPFWYNSDYSFWVDLHARRSVCSAGAAQ